MILKNLTSFDSLDLYGFICTLLTKNIYNGIQLRVSQCSCLYPTVVIKHLNTCPRCSGIRCYRQPVIWSSFNKRCTPWSGKHDNNWKCVSLLQRRHHAFSWDSGRGNEFSCCKCWSNCGLSQSIVRATGRASWKPHLFKRPSNSKPSDSLKELKTPLQAEENTNPQWMGPSQSFLVKITSVHYWPHFFHLFFGSSFCP